MALGAILVVPGIMVNRTNAQADDRIRFGMDHASIDAQEAAGVKPDYATIWIGPWTLRSGYGSLDAMLTRSTSEGVTPLIHLYYWGNDISRQCVDSGCQTGAGWKSRSGWQSLADGMVDHLWSKRGGKPAVVVVETEFNKNDVGAYEPLDGYLSSLIGSIKSGYPAATVVLGFGNWNSGTWGTYDRAAGTAHWVGIQGMRASTRDSQSSYYTIDDALLSGSQKLQSLFRKPILVTDVALASYPDDTYAWHQKQALASIFGRLDALRDAGVRALVYRALDDNPSATTAEYYGQAERHFGLRRSDGGWKGAMGAWKEGVLAERSGAAAAPAASSSALAIGPARASFAQVEAFTTKTAGGVQGDSGASGGKRWNLWSNGIVAQELTVEKSGWVWLQVRAGGHRLDGLAPHMIVKLGGATVLQAHPAGYDTYAVDRWLDAGTHRLEIGYWNDARNARGDRNLLLDTVTVAPARPFEAESAATRTTGRWEADSAASNDARWNLWGNGHVAHSVDLAAGTYDIRVRARGVPLDGVAPRMVVSVDGGQARPFDVGSGYAAYVGTYGVSWNGAHSIRVAFTNDDHNARGDRNLLVDEVEVVRRP